MEKSNRLPKLEEGLILALQALDNQVKRALERTPAEREESGVQKWKPHEERIEKVCGFVLDNFGEEIELDSVLIMSQAFVKVLSIICDELGAHGLGDIRSSYVKETLSRLSIEIERSKNIFREDSPRLM
ncbi:MAG TPA: hypothetical protein PKA63_05210 [Oligoflexia bacterium]|nr:hypothetical protein [Oligoflexia bacterium]HMP48046.1 hypothetical protein [Oligoflexia bacterium]